MARRICEQASTDPTASPSGRACEVRTKRSRRSICFRTSVTIARPFYIRGPGRLLLPFLRTIQQFADPRLVLVRSVDVKKQLWRTSQLEPFRQFVANIAARRV